MRLRDLYEQAIEKVKDTIPIVVLSAAIVLMGVFYLWYEWGTWYECLQKDSFFYCVRTMR